MFSKIIPNSIFAVVFFFSVITSFSQPQRDTLAPFWNAIPVPNPSTIRTISIDSNNTIFIGVWGDGIYRSFNNGQNWSAINNGLSNKYVTSIEFDSLGRIYVSTYGGGVFYSTNNGQVWTPVNNGLPGLKVKALKIKYPSTVFIAIEGYGVFRSTNQGASWTAVATGIWFLDVNCLTIGDIGTIIAGTNGDGIYYSDNDGASWRRSGFGNNFKVITSFAKSSLGEIICGTYQGGVYSSVDHGLSWVVFKRKDTLKNVTAVTWANSAEPIAGTDRIGIFRYDSRVYEDWRITNLREAGITAMARNSNGLLFAASSDGALYKSTDGGANWTSIRSSNNFVNSFHSFNKVLFIALNDGTSFKSTNYGISWSPMNISNFTISKFANDSTGRIFALGRRTDTNLNSVLISTDLGNTWTTLLAKSDTIFTSIGIKDNYVFLGIKFPPADPRNPNSPSSDLLRSSDGGTSWAALGIRSKSIEGIPFIGVNTSGVIYVSLMDSLIKSTNNGNSWTMVLGKTMYNYRTLAFTQNSTIFIAGDYAILKSTNEGTSWTTKSLGIFYQYMQSIAVSPYNQIIAGSTYGGLLTSVDNGSTWDSTHIYYGFIREPISSIQTDKNGYLWIVSPTNIYRAITPQAISKVDLISPQTNAVGIPIKASFQWSQIENADLYEFVISEDYDFNTVKEKIILGANTRTNYYELNYNTLYFWRVRGRLNNALGEWSRTFSFTTIVAPPRLIAPPNNKGAVPLKPAFVWSKSEGASGYILQVSKSQNFSSLVFEKTQTKITDTTFTSTTNLEYFQKYYWRVCAKVGSLQSDWSEVWEFTTKIEAPKLRSPLHKTFGVPLIATLEWFPTTGGTLYEIQIALDSNFENKFYEGTTPFNDRFETKILEYFTKYYWRIRASNDDGSSDWSETWWFITKIQQPILRTPEDKSKNLGVPISFSWDALPDATSYEIQIATNSNFTSLVVNDSSLKTNAYSLNNTQEFTTYYWRVRYIVNQYKSEWSTVFSFTTSLGVPKLVYPPNNSDSIPIFVIFEWQSVVGASLYEFVLSTDSLFSKDIIDIKDSITQNQIAVSQLQYNQKYYWRVRAKNTFGNGNWSETWAFTTTQPSGIDNDWAINESIIIAPNPVYSSLSIFFANSHNICNIKIIDVLGRIRFEVSKNEKMASPLNLDLNYLESGIYFVIFEFANKNEMQKIIKK